MNIEYYRALKAQEAKEVGVTPPVEQTQPTLEENKTPVEENKTPSLPEKVVIDGVGEVSFDELKNGYLRQSDYTRKTQEVSRKSKEVEDAVNLMQHLKANPHLAQQLLQSEKLPAPLDPTTSRVVELENKLYDMMLQQEIQTLQSKYTDFEVMDVLKVAQEKGIVNLEDAYLITKAHKPTAQVVDAEVIKKQIREEVLRELEKERKDTQTIISTNDGVAHVVDKSPSLSEAEKKVAKMMSMSDVDYVKWRDISKKK